MRVYLPPGRLTFLPGALPLQPVGVVRLLHLHEAASLPFELRLGRALVVQEEGEGLALIRSCARRGEVVTG